MSKMPNIKQMVRKVKMPKLPKNLWKMMLIVLLLVGLFFLVEFVGLVG